MPFSQFDVDFTRDGSIYDQESVTGLRNGLTSATDLLVLTHGWNNGRADAREFNDSLIGSLESIQQPTSRPGSKYAVLRVFWPTKKFIDQAAWVASDNDAALRASLDTLKHDPELLGQGGDAPNHHAGRPMRSLLHLRHGHGPPRSQP
jgi:hypothetical protein